MATIDPTTISSDKRDIGLRTRPDLVINKSVYQGEYCWIVKDPLAMKFFRLRKGEILVLNALRETISYHEIRQLLNVEFPELVVKLETVRQLISQLHRSGLLISQSSGQAKPLGKRKIKEQQQKWMQMLMSIYALRFPGWDPNRFLDWLYPKCRFLFSIWFTFVVALTCLGAVLLVGLNLQSFQAKLPEFSQFFAAENLLLMMGLLVFTKSIHELGHGLMCKHFGGECHQIGFMLLVLTPAMYCDTSDSWTLRNRWHRMAIGAAGMYVELFLAALCTLIWWFTQPGWLHYLALNIMFLSSVTTLLFNANPLLRYDGYYILSDYWEVPNLAQKSRLLLLSKLRTWAVGMKPVPSHLLPEKKLISVAIYGVLALAYRIFVMIAIGWFIHEIMQPYGMQAFAHVFIFMSLSGLLIMPIFKLVKFFSFPGRFREVDKKRTWISAFVLAALLFIIGYVPLPHYVWADFIVRPMGAQNLIVTHEGHLQQVNFCEGDFVKEGETIAVIENHELKLQYEELLGQLARLESDRIAFEYLSTSEIDSARKLAETVAELKGVRRQLDVMENKIDELEIQARRSGRLFAPQNIASSYLETGQLPSWSDTPLAPKNQGAFLEANTLLGSIGKNEQMEIILVVNESDVEYLSVGQPVTALSKSASDTFLHGELTVVADDQLDLLPRELSQTNRGPIAVEPDSEGKERPLLKFYEAYVGLDSSELMDANVQLLPGSIGKARVLVGQMSIGNRLLRYVQSIIKFR